MILPSSKRSTGLGRFGKRAGLWMAGLLVAVVFLQLPMVKGMYYRVTGSPADGIAWRTDLASALQESTKTGKPVLVDFSASWCPPCQVMKHEVWPDAEVGKAVREGFIPLALDADDAATREPAQRYGIEGIPALLILDSQGHVLRHANFLEKAGLLEFLIGK